MKLARYIPQIRGDEDGLWADLWYAPVPYSRAEEIRDQVMRSGISRDRLRIEWKESA